MSSTPHLIPNLDDHVDYQHSQHCGRRLIASSLPSKTSSTALSSSSSLSSQEVDCSVESREKTCCMVGLVRSWKVCSDLSKAKAASIIKSEASTIQDKLVVVKDRSRSQETLEISPSQKQTYKERSNSTPTTIKRSLEIGGTLSAESSHSQGKRQRMSNPTRVALNKPSKIMTKSKENHQDMSIIIDKYAADCKNVQQEKRSPSDEEIALWRQAQRTKRMAMLLRNLEIVQQSLYAELVQALHERESMHN